MAGKIVHDNDITGFEHGYELLLDIGTEALAVDRSVEDARCGQPVIAQRSQKGQRAPVAMRCKCMQTLALRSPTPDGRHVGLDPCLVNEDEPFGIEMRLEGFPSLTSASDIGAGLFKGEQCFF